MLQRLQVENARLRFELDWFDVSRLVIRSRVPGAEGKPRKLPNKKLARTKKATNARLRNYYATNPEYRARKLARAKAERDIAREVRNQKPTTTA